jgi:Immunity protein 7
MFQLNGWAEILTTTTGDEDPTKLHELVVSLKGRIASLTLGDRVDVVGRGGSYLLRIAIVQNRERGDLDRFTTLLTELGVAAPGTYGVFYLRDDEQSGSFVRFVIRRGLLERKADDLFSPSASTIEDV